MSRRRIEMRRVVNILKMRFDNGWAVRKIAEVAGVSVGTVHSVVKRFEESALVWPLEPGAEARLCEALHPPRGGKGEGEVDFAWVEEQCRGKAVTLKLLWSELRDEGYPHAYSWFCRCYREWLKAGRRSMRQRHEPGDTVYVDFAGMTVAVGKSRAQVFVAAFGLSHYCYAEAVRSQSLGDWIGCQDRMLRFYGGVPRLIVPDNLKSAITAHCRYNPEVNSTYGQWAEHYNVAIMPTRPRRPRDKAVAENAVQQVERWVLARLHNCAFETLAHLNERIRTLRKELNEKPFSNRPGSRLEAFEMFDAPALRPLPLFPYCYADISFAKVGPDYHVRHGGHWYSVPHEYVAKRVEIRAAEHLVTVHFGQAQIASHRRRSRYGHTTEAAHMPESHALYDRWTPAAVISWASAVGDECGAWVRARIDEAAHFQQVRRSMLGVLSLSRKYGEKRLDAACAIAARQGLARFSQIRSILENGVDLRCENRAMKLQLPQDHENVRGAEQFK